MNDEIRITISGTTNDRTLAATLRDGSPMIRRGLMDYEVVALVAAIQAGAEPSHPGPDTRPRRARPRLAMATVGVA